jgi:hypothetical protein
MYLVGLAHFFVAEPMLLEFDLTAFVYGRFVIVDHNQPVNTRVARTPANFPPLEGGLT